MFRSPDLNRQALKVKSITLTVDLRTLRYIFKALPLFVGKFQPFEFKTDFGIFPVSILSSPVFKVTTR